jgi:UDP-glucose 4-epimerase
MTLPVDKRVVVLGGSGFLGRAVCARLHAQGVDVTAMSRQTDPHNPPWKHVPVDAEDSAALSAALKAARPDIIFHLAGLASARPERELVRPMLRSHVMSILNVLDYAAEAGCDRVICTASLEEPVPPESVARSPYAVAKWAAGAYGQMYQALYGTPVVFARVFMVYGPGPQNLNKVLPYAALSMLRGESPALSSGSRAFDWVYIDDVAKGLVACATAPGIEGRRIDIGSGETRTVQEVVNLAADLIGSSVRPSFGALPDRVERSVTRANVDEAHALTGWRPSIGLREGVGRTIEWLRQNALGR